MAALIDLAGPEAADALRRDVTFKAQLELLVACLPAMVRGLAAEVPARTTRTQAAVRAAETSSISAENLRWAQDVIRNPTGPGCPPVPDSSDPGDR